MGAEADPPMHRPRAPHCQPCKYHDEGLSIACLLRMGNALRQSAAHPQDIQDPCMTSRTQLQLDMQWQGRDLITQTRAAGTV